MWEHWEFSDNTYSHNHPMFGSVSQWFYNWLGGIQADSEAVGFDQIIIRPQVISDLEWVKCSHDSVRGRITSNWKKKEGNLFFEIQIPVNAEATVYLPAQKNSRIFESGKNIEEVAGIQLLHKADGAVICRIGSGSYVLEIR